jgi:hypothetical protein
MEIVVVTRHPALVEYLIENGIIDQHKTTVVTHATVEQVKGKHVVGVLPLRLAAMAACITEVPLIVPPEMRGVELTVEDIRKFAGEPATYSVNTI